MENNTSEREQLVRTALHGAGAPAAGESAHGAHLWEQLAGRLSSVIGEAGFCALYARALALAGAPVEMREASIVLKSTGTMVKALNEGLDGLAPERAQELNAALLSMFTSLLAGLIGEALTIRLLKSAWAEWSEEKRL